MIPKEQKEPAMAVTGDTVDFSGPVPVLDLGKKLSVPQDLMMEELSLHNNRGSLLFQKRQRRVLAGSARGKATRSGSAGPVANGPEEQISGAGLPACLGLSADPGRAHPAAAPAESVRGPSALAPGYAEPLKGVPPEKFNHTAIPKGYRCPWQEFISYRDYASPGGDSLGHTPRLRDCRNFNKTPVPFGGPLVGRPFPGQAPPLTQSPSVAWNSFASDPASTGLLRAGSEAPRV